MAGCGTKHAKRLPATTSSPTVPASDVVTLNRLLDLEYLTIAAYTAGIPLLAGGASAAAAKRFLGQELSHAGELSGLVKEAGAKPHQPEPSYDLGHPRGAADVLRLLHQLESAQLSAYLAAIGSLEDGKVRAGVASVLSNDAQHVSILRVRLGQPPVPAAFVTGQE